MASTTENTGYSFRRFMRRAFMKWLSYLKPPRDFWNLVGVIITLIGLLVGAISLVRFILGALGVIAPPTTGDVKLMLGGIAAFMVALVLLFIQAPYELWKKDMVAKDKKISTLTAQIAPVSRLYVFVEHFDIKRIGTNRAISQRIQINVLNCTTGKVKIDRGTAKIANIGNATIDKVEALEGTPYTLEIGELRGFHCNFIFDPNQLTRIDSVINDDPTPAITASLVIEGLSKAKEVPQLWPGCHRDVDISD